MNVQEEEDGREERAARARENERERNFLEEQRERGEEEEEEEEEEGEGEGEREEEEEEAGSSRGDRKVKKLGKKKLEKLERKEEKRKLRQYLDAQKEERKKQEEEELAEWKRRKQAEREAEEEERRREREEREERERREREEYERLRREIKVEQRGEEQLSAEQLEEALGAMALFIRSSKVVTVEELASEFSLRSAEAARRLRLLDSQGRIQGILDERGKYVYVSQEEMDRLAAFVVRRGRFSKAELASAANNLISLSPAPS